MSPHIIIILKETYLKENISLKDEDRQSHWHETRNI